MKLLVLGGTVFLGRHVVNEAIARGHEVTIYSRGLHGTPHPGAEHVKGDRADVTPLQGRHWDAAIDTSGFEADQVKASASLDLGHYVFVSSCNAYPDWPEKPVDEDSADVAGRRGLRAGQGRERTRRPRGHGRALRHGARRADRRPARQHLPPPVVGEPDHGGRPHPRAGRPRAAAADHRRARPRGLPRRPRGTGHGGRVQRHGSDRADDVRASCSPPRATRSSCGSRTSSSSTAEVQEWTELPMWLPADAYPGTWRIGTANAQAAGLTTRPVAGDRPRRPGMAGRRRRAGSSATTAPSTGRRR